MTEPKKKITKTTPGGIKKAESFDLLDITASLGYQTYRRNGRNSWSREDDEELVSLIDNQLKYLGYPNGIGDVQATPDSAQILRKIPWDVITNQFSNKTRSAKDLRKRWTGSLDPSVKKGRWTEEEDALLLKSYEKHGPHWLSVSMEIAGRTEDQCAKRYVEVLGPSSKGRLREWSEEEDLSLISKVKKYGTKWRRISSEMEFRPSLTCRNRWRKIITMVVREQASDAIMTAVKENKDIDLSGSNLTKKQAKNDQINTNNITKQTPDAETNSLQGSNEKIRNVQLLNNAPNSLSKLSQFRNNDNSVNANNKYPSIELPSRASSPIPQLPPSKLLNPLLSGDQPVLPLPSGTPPPTNLPSQGRLLQKSITEVRNSPLNSSSSNLKMDLHTSSQPNLQSNFLFNAGNNTNSRYQYSTAKGPELISGNNNNNLNNNAISSDNIIPKKPPTPAITQTEWKFVLKDGKGLSISNGTIATSKLVEELIEQAKKYSLKISLHQHIHHHYNSNISSRVNDFDTRNEPLNSMVINQTSQFSKNNIDIPTNHTSPSVSSANLSNIQNSLFPDLVMDRGNITTMQDGNHNNNNVTTSNNATSSHNTDEPNSKMGFIPNKDIDKNNSLNVDFKSQLVNSVGNNNQVGATNNTTTGTNLLSTTFSPNYSNLGLELSPSPITGSNLINDIHEQFANGNNTTNAGNNDITTNTQGVDTITGNNIYYESQQTKINEINTSTNTGVLMVDENQLALNINNPGGVIVSGIPTSSSNSSFSPTTLNNVQKIQSTTRDVGPNRSSHFNYLPPTIRPQLESSDHPRGASLSKLLNPSPRSNSSGNSKSNHRSPSSGSPSSSSSSQQQQHQRRMLKKRKRRNSSRARSNSNSSKSRKNSLSQRQSPNVMISTIQSQQSPGGGIDSSSANEDGVDFWETLRSLADNPAIKDNNSNTNNDHVNDHSTGVATTPSGMSQVREEDTINSLFHHHQPPQSTVVSKLNKNEEKKEEDGAKKEEDEETKKEDQTKEISQSSKQSDEENSKEKQVKETTEPSISSEYADEENIDPLLHLNAS